ncbi:MAG: Tfp pilus assembly protein FimT/FimU [Vibrio sp.]
MPRGLTLIETVISIFILGMLLIVAVPSFSTLNDKYKVKRFIHELQFIYLQTRSQAVLNNQNMNFKFSVDCQDMDSTWCFVVKSNVLENVHLNENKDNFMLYLTDKNFKNINVSANFDEVKFDATNGWPSKSGTVIFFIDETEKFRFIFHHITARHRICSEGQSLYDFPIC